MSSHVRHLLSAETKTDGTPKDSKAGQGLPPPALLEITTYYSRHRYRAVYGICHPTPNEAIKSPSPLHAKG